MLTMPINSVGCVKVHGTQYVPNMGIDRENRDGSLLPQSEQVVFPNLRSTVLSLANVKTPIEYRRRFYDNNPIPGCIWTNAPGSPVLSNPDDIMPNGYGLDDLHDDMYDLHIKLYFLATKAPNYFSEPLSLDSGGSKAMLVSNNQSGMHIDDRDVNEPLDVYYRRLTIKGDIPKFWSFQLLTPGEQLRGSISLLGERPLSAGACTLFTSRTHRKFRITLWLQSFAKNCARTFILKEMTPRFFVSVHYRFVSVPVAR